MVKLTSDLIIRHGSHSKKQNYESDFQFLRRLTHVYCQEKHIDEIVSALVFVCQKTYYTIAQTDGNFNTQ